MLLLQIAELVNPGAIDPTLPTAPPVVPFEENIVLPSILIWVKPMLGLSLGLQI